MKRLLIAALVALGIAGSAYAGDTWVNGYYRGDGTYVQGHYRSAPDGNPYNNYSTEGNVNPYTGATGTARPAPNTRSGYSTPSYGTPATQPTAVCRDGTYSYSQSRSGTCSYHGGVARWN